jgi:hypothetical protein
MKPTNMIIAFDSIEQLDHVLKWAYARGLDWNAPNCRKEAREHLCTIFSNQQSHAIMVDDRGHLYQSSLSHFKQGSEYEDYAFTHATKLSIGIDCTIPETEGIL